MRYAALLAVFMSLYDAETGRHIITYAFPYNNHADCMRDAKMAAYPPTKFFATCT